MPTAPPEIDPDERVAVIGIGSRLRGDDAAGLDLLERLDERRSQAGRKPEDRLLLVEGGVAPENHTGVVRRFDPDWIVLLDAVAMDAEPGTGAWVDPEDLGGESFSSHKSTPAMLQTFLARETGADVALFGVQPAAIEQGAELSPALEERLDALADRLAEVLEIGSS